MKKKSKRKPLTEEQRAKKRKRNRKWILANREKCLAMNRSWRAKNLEKIRGYKVANCEKMREASRKWRCLNREKIKAYRRKPLTEEQRMEKRERDRKWVLANREKCLAMSRRWRADQIKFKSAVNFVQTITNVNKLREVLKSP